MTKTLTFIIILFLFNTSFCQYDTLRDYYPNGLPQSVIPIRKNIREGAAIFYFPNGKIKQECTYRNGVIDGFVKEYNFNGTLKETYTIENGKRQGPASYYDSTGNYIADKLFDEGKLTSEPQEENEEATTEQVTIGGNMPPQNQTKHIIVEEQTPVDSSYYTVVDTLPVPAEGWKHLYSILYYPEDAVKNKIQGIVMVKALINEHGDVEKTEAVEKLGYGCDDAAEILIFYAKFKPGILKGRPVKVETNIPVVFKLP
jgi:TonB family protein